MSLKKLKSNSPIGKKIFTSHISENLFYMYTKKLLYFNKKKKPNKQKMLMKKRFRQRFYKRKYMNGK